MPALSSLKLGSSCMRLALSDTQHFLRPSPDPESVPSEDPIIRGSLHLSLSKPKKIKKIAVRLERFYSVCFPDQAYESGHNTISEVELCSEAADERLFAKGEHVFAFNLIVPASTAPFERCQYGRVYHKVIAVAEGDGLLSSDVQASHPVFLIANPAADGDTADLNMRVEGYNESVGPYAIATAAQHFTVGGLINFDLLLASVPEQTEIISVSAHMNAHYTLRSLEHPDKKPQQATRRTKLFLVDAAHPEPEDTHAVALDQCGNVTPPPHPASSAYMLAQASSSNGEASGLVASEAPAGIAPFASASFSPSSRGMLSSLSSSASPSSSRSSNNHSSSSSSSVGSSSATSRSSGRHPGFKHANTFNPPAQPATYQSRSMLPIRSNSTPTPLSTGPAPHLPLQTVRPGGSFSLRHLARIPNDDILRPSTLPGTKTPIEGRHELVVEVRFRPLPPATTSSSSSTGSSDSSDPTKSKSAGKVLVLRSERPVVISSCCCMLSSLLVPAYSEALSTPPASIESLLKDESRASKGLFIDDCICCQSKEDLIKQQRLAEDRFAARVRNQTNGGGRFGGAGMGLGLLEDGRVRTGVDGLRIKYEYAPVRPEHSSSTSNSPVDWNAEV